MRTVDYERRRRGHERTYCSRRGRLSRLRETDETDWALPAIGPGHQAVVRYQPLPGGRSVGDRLRRRVHNLAAGQLLLLLARHQRPDELHHVGRGHVLCVGQADLGVPEFPAHVGLPGHDVPALPVARPPQPGCVPPGPRPVIVRIHLVRRALVVRYRRLVPVAILHRRRLHGRGVRRRRAPVPVERAKLLVPGRRAVLQQPLPVVLLTRND